MGKIFSLSNQKGGVGKTTTAVNLGFALAKIGKKTLICDIDPQGNATTGVGVEHTDRKHDSYKLMIGQSNLESAIVQTPYQNLFVVPSTVDLAGAEIELVDMQHREAKLKEGLRPAKDMFDFVLIDCPPSLGLLTVNSLVAADQLFIPIQSEYYALEGVTQLLSTFQLIRKTLNPALSIFGVLLTMYDERTTLSRAVANEIKQHFGDVLFNTIIPRNVRISEAPSHGKPISVYDPTSKGAIAYEQLAQEVVERVGK